MKNPLDAEYLSNTLPPICTEEDEIAINKLFTDYPQLKSEPIPPRDLSKDPDNGYAVRYDIGSEEFNPEEAWIQTFSGVRFTPTNPNYESIVIQDIAHALSMQCRFSGHVKRFYSVAQHSVLVSYLCDSSDRLWGLLHDATEAYLIDVPSPLKRSGKFGAYIEFEKIMQEAICKRFNLPMAEPPSVKIADGLMLATEARDLMSPLREDWITNIKPIPLKIEPLGPAEAEVLFLNRFYELVGK
jgi:hypothetical protein